MQLIPLCRPEGRFRTSAPRNAPSRTMNRVQHAPYQYFSNNLSLSPGLAPFQDLLGVPGGAVLVSDALPVFKAS